MLSTTARVMISAGILGVGIILIGVVGLPQHAPKWQLFADAYLDQILVTRAEYRPDDNELRVRAETSSATSVLTVFDLRGDRIGTMEREDETRHEGRFVVPSNPRVITVRSSEGGSVTVLVSGDSPPTVTPHASPTVTPTTTPDATIGTIWLPRAVTP